MDTKIKKNYRPSNLGHISSRLFFIWCHCKRLRFLVDTGAMINLISFTRAERHQTPNSPPQATNGSTNNTCGLRPLTFNIALRCTFSLVFFIASATHPKLRTDLSIFNVSVNVSNHRLIDNATTLIVNGVGSRSVSLGFSCRFSQFRFPKYHGRVYDNYAALLPSALGSAWRRSSYWKCKTIRFCATSSTFWPASVCCKRELKHILELAIIFPTSSNWAPPLHMVTKKILEPGHGAWIIKYWIPAHHRTDIPWFIYKTWLRT